MDIEYIAVIEGKNGKPLQLEYLYFDKGPETARSKEIAARNDVEMVLICRRDEENPITTQEFADAEEMLRDGKTTPEELAALLSK